MIRKHRIVLSLDQVLIEEDILQTPWPVSLQTDISGNELLLIRLEQPGQCTILGDLFSGLLHPSVGNVRFLGRDWSKVGPDFANGMRGKIGRIFCRGAWFIKLTIRENILMRPLHHSRLSVAKVQAEAAQLGLDLGLPGLPTGYPEEALPTDLERAAWIRAFLGTPQLILLEEPFQDWPHPASCRLIQVMGRARLRGAAVIWMTRNPSVWKDSSLPATRRMRLANRRLTEVTCP
ncbi:MAG: hypothetical protein R2940_04685 [Syntrophotaleaceae bacterium]